MLGHVEGPVGPPRALGGQDEACEVGAGLGRGGDVLLEGQPAHLHERPREELAELRTRVGGPHQGGADEDRVRPGQLGRGCLGARLDAALRDDDPVPRSASDEVELGAAVDLERGEVARVDPDRVGAEGDGAVELLGGVGLDEGVETEVAGGCHESRGGTIVEVAEQE